MGNYCQPASKVDNEEITVQDIKKGPSAKKLTQFLQYHPIITSKLQQIRINLHEKQFQGYNRMMEITGFLKNCEDFEFQDGTFLTLPSFSGPDRNGFGIMLYNEKGEHKSTYYEGYWCGDQRDQWGIYISEEGDVYVGGWKNDAPDGKGHYKSEKNQSEYFGEWVKGEKNGRGRQIYPNGDYYDGQFKNDKMEGEGIFVSREQRYEGSWKNGVFDGSGKTEWYDLMGNIIGAYIGQYRQGKKDGYGEYTDSKGCTFKATWQKGKMKQSSSFIRSSMYS